jgi:integrase
MAAIIWFSTQLSIPKHEELAVMVVSIARHSEEFLVVRFPFDPKVVESMRTVPGRRWSAGDQAWLIPNGRAEGERLLDALYDTGMFSLFDSRDASPAGFFDETLRALERALESRHYSPRTIQAYAQWVRRFLEGHKGHALASLGEKEINAFLTRLAVDGNVSSSTQNQALAAALMYGTGMRLMECLTLRVQDIDFERSEILVRNGKGAKDHVTMLPGTLKEPLKEQLAGVKAIHEADREEGWGAVPMPDALDRKYRSGATEWSWQYVFPQERRWTNAPYWPARPPSHGRVSHARPSMPPF